jgi:hypothetical protein
MASTTDTTTLVMRWLARLIGAGLAGLVVSMGFIAALDGRDWTSLGDLLTLQGIMTIDLWAIALASLVIAFAWEGIGGLGITLVSLAMLTFNLVRVPARFDPPSALFALVGLAFLACWWRTRRLHWHFAAFHSYTRTRHLRLDDATPPSTRQVQFASLRGPTTNHENLLARGKRRGPANMLTSWVSPRAHGNALDAIRETIEQGSGGDLDSDGRLTRRGHLYVPGLKRTVSAWVRLHERVRRGDLGGPEDGEA